MRPFLPPRRGRLRLPYPNVAGGPVYYLPVVVRVCPNQDRRETPIEEPKMALCQEIRRLVGDPW
jgi:hypothetical protein